MAERTVQTVKKLLMKAKKWKSSISCSLRTEKLPLDGLRSPVQLLYGHRTRTVLPIKPSLLKLEKAESVPSVLNEKQLLLWIICVIYVLCLSRFHICSLLPCGHLLGKG